MPTYTFYIYSVDVLSYNGATNEFDFDAGYDFTTDRYRIDVTDDDATMNSGGDANQLATIYDMDGNLVDSGNIFVPFYAQLDNGAFLDRIEINGTHYGYTSSTPLTPGTSYGVASSATFQDVHTYYETNSVPCFGGDTVIETPSGYRPITLLKPGDDVLTLDNGPQPILWAGSRRVTAWQAQLSKRLQPIRFSGGMGGVATPFRPLTLSQQHRVLVADPAAQLLCGQPEVFVAARNFAPPSVPRTGVMWHHILLPRHEVIRANGVWVESLFAGGTLSDLTSTSQSRAIEIALAGRLHMATTRPCLRRHEARVLLGHLRARALPESRNKRVA